MSTDLPGRAVYLVDGMRTPFLRAQVPAPGPFAAADLAVRAGQSLFSKLSLSPKIIQHIVVGCGGAAADEMNIARIVGLRLGCEQSTPAFTVQRNCASGLQAVDSGAQMIASGRHDLVLVGGCEAMSHAPLMSHPNIARWLAQLQKAKGHWQKLKLIPSFPFKNLKPESALLKGLSDPVVGLSMGQTAEIIAKRFNIDRQMMDAWAAQSHLRALAAQKNNIFSEEITPLYDGKGSSYLIDNGVRTDSTAERLAKLKPVFDRPYGHVTAGNSSQLTDGACLLLLASDKAVKKYQLKPLAKIKDVAWAGLDPRHMGLGPVHASHQILKRQKIAIEQIDCWEINEAFAAQTLACLAAFNDLEFCKSELKLRKAYGVIDREKVNVHGGAIAIGHPVGASGTRILLHLAQVLKSNNAPAQGIASLCIGGGQGGAMLIENCQQKETVE
ncbi:putative acetyl-CoA acyltransferase [Piscirickettsia salmonis]|uniref:acetyl-CoA C-acetyltransferase n=1 Tax=Piscirickettsia salmonis TaxID=1238 RepID=UPI0012B8C134|nr:acetyl-CoA C-acetyltransferase [Piscirickettsia salmonis]QGP49773.1 putative acetyl-CoA acyltransferase [Piscirickettsia salmonis]